MIYSKRDLRNTNNPLLRRLQRQVETKNESMVKNHWDKVFKEQKEKEMKIKNDKENNGKNLLKGIDNDFDILTKVKNTRLHLYNKRGGR